MFELLGALIISVMIDTAHHAEVKNEIKVNEEKIVELELIQAGMHAEESMINKELKILKVKLDTKTRRIQWENR